MTGESPSGTNLQRMLPLLRRRGPIVVLCVLLAAGTAYVVVRHQPKQYAATAALNFQPDQLAQAASGLPAGFGAAPNQSQLDTNVALVGTGDVAARTAAVMGPGWTVPRVRGSLNISASGDTSIVLIRATTRNPVIAQKLANTYANLFVTEQKVQYQAGVAAAQRQVNAEFNSLTAAEKAGTQGILLANRAQSLSILGQVASGSVAIAGVAGLPHSATSPSVKRDAILGAILGLLIGIVIASVLERLDPRMRDRKEFEALYDLPLLGAVPERSEFTVLKSLDRSKQPRRPSSYGEIFNLLRSYLRYSPDRQLLTLLVISPGPREGKTTVSYNLAKAAALLGSRVLVIEADLRRPTAIGPLLDRPAPALPDVLNGDASMEDAIRTVQVGDKGSFDVLVSGATPTARAGELIESPAMQSLLGRAREAYELVVIDTPPLSLVADAVPLLTTVDGVIVVGRIGKSRRESAEQLRDMLKSMRVPVLGVVVNGVPDRQRGRGRLYGYDYAYRNVPYVPAQNGSGGLPHIPESQTGVDEAGDSAPVSPSVPPPRP